jgi:hypothetical protein
MNRLEIIMDQTIEDIFLEHLHRELPEAPFSLHRETLGNGASGPRMGTAVWPEENSLFVIYTGQRETESISAILREMKSAHPGNGIAAFLVPRAEELLENP